MGHLNDYFFPKKRFKNILTLLTVALLSSSHAVDSDCDSCHAHHYLRTKIGPDQKRFTTRFWEFSSESDTWVAVKFPFHGDPGETDGPDQTGSPEKEKPAISYPGLGVRKRMSLTKMNDGSIWVSGESGMIYERFWNGLQWVIAPHALPVHAGYAVSVFFVGQRILALSEAGRLYQLNEESQPMWAELALVFDKGKSEEAIQLSSGVLANDKERMYFCTKNGFLLEVFEINPPSWKYHGQPSGANVAAIADVDTFKPGLLFIVSSSGDLYEYDQTSKPPWKKHIRQKDNSTTLAASKGCSLHGLVGPHSLSLFLLTKMGELIERRLHQRKWKWVVHGNPKGHVLTSITCIPNDQNPNTLFITTAAGFVYQYRIPNHPGMSHDQEINENWLNHNHPPHARAARGILGLHLQPGRMIFSLDDGRLAELHLPGHGGEGLGPNTPLTTRRKPSLKYIWSILDAPESEGWNAEYCTEQRGPTNCIVGSKDESTEKTLFPIRRTQQSYLIPRREKDIGIRIPPDYKRGDRLFRLRSMQEGRSFFLISDEGVTFECVNDGNAWFWLDHKLSTRVEGVVGKYNGSLFVVDEDGSLHMRERSLDNLAWVNFTSMRRGKVVINGPPWDSFKPRAHPEDSLFFVSESGRLMRVNVAQRKFKWKDCKSPPGIKIVSIADQEGFRQNVVFVVGENGRLYQYNKVSGVWHEHYQSRHLVLSRSPGTAVRGLGYSTEGSLFLLSDEGGLVEYRWGLGGGWNWIEHGMACRNVTLVGAPGPCLGGTDVFLTGSDGNVYRRYLDGGEWKWEDCGFPGGGDDDGQLAEKFEDADRNCNPKVSSTRPIAFSEKSVIFELQDGRMAELSRKEDGSWLWSRAIVAPASLCMRNHWSPQT